MEKYLKRIADEVLPDRLAATGCLLIAGPKWCGKSTTAMRFAKSSVFMQDPSKRDNYIRLAKTYPERFLIGEVPRLIDEWQVIPFIWDAIRYEVDRRGERGLFLLTGSAVPPSMEEIMHTGAGRISRYVMRPMSLWESEESNGAVSLSALLGDEEVDVVGETDMNLDSYAWSLARGGWPAVVTGSIRNALQMTHDLYEAIVSSDVSRVDGVNRSEERARLLMRAYARATATQANYSTLRNDMASNLVGLPNNNTMASYVDALKKLYVVEDLPSWYPDFRKKTTLRTSDVRHFVDPSLACAALGMGPGDLLDDMRTFGYLFESMVVRDLRIYSEKLGGKVYHYRDANGLEADAVVHLPNGRYGIVEVKLHSEDIIEEGAANLLKLAGRLDTRKMRKPSFLAVITCGQFAYRREDGVYVIPLGCLKP